MVVMASDPEWCVHTVPRCANPPNKVPAGGGGIISCDSFVPSLPRGMRAGLPQANGLIICVCKPGEKHPIWQDEALGLNSALGYVPATPAADGAPPSALQPGAKAWGFLGLSKSLTPKSAQTKRRKKPHSEGGVAYLASARKRFDSPSRAAGV